MTRMLAFACVCALSMELLAPVSAQQQKWFFPGAALDLTEQSCAPLFDGTTSAHRSNGVVDETGNILFYVFDDQVYNPVGQPFFFTGAIPRFDLEIIPRPSFPDEFYLVTNTPNGLISDLIDSKDLGFPTVYQHFADYNGVMAVSQPLSGFASRRYLYVESVFFDVQSIRRWQIDATGIHTEKTILNGVPGSIGNYGAVELELSHNGRMIAGAIQRHVNPHTPYADAVYVLELDSNGDYVSHRIFTHPDDDTCGANEARAKVSGFEFSSDDEKLFVSFESFCSDNDGIFIVNLVPSPGEVSASPLSESETLHSTQLELGPDGRLYGADTEGILHGFDSQFPYQRQVTLSCPSMMITQEIIRGTGADYPIMILPDQIDAPARCVLNNVSNGIQQISVDSQGQPRSGESGRHGYDLSEDGRYIVFESSASFDNRDQDNPPRRDIYIRDLSTPGSPQTELVSVSVDGMRSASFHCFNPAISGNGRFVAFASDARNLVDPEPTFVYHVYVWDRVRKRMTLITPPDADNHSGFRSVAISENGLFLAFDSEATNLGNNPDTNGKRDVFVYDAVRRETRRISEDANGAGGDADSLLPVVSADGQFVAFTSGATNFVSDAPMDIGQIYLWDRNDPDDLMLVSRSSAAENPRAPARTSCSDPAISGDGRYITFQAAPHSNLLGGTTPQDWTQRHLILVRDVVSQQTTLISKNLSGDERGPSSQPDISADGRYIVFHSSATTGFVEIDENHDKSDIFLHDRDPDEDGTMDEEGEFTTVLISRDQNGQQANEVSEGGKISADRRRVVFESVASFVPEDTNGNRDVYALDVTQLRCMRVSAIRVDVDASPLLSGGSGPPGLLGDGSRGASYLLHIRIVVVDNDNNPVIGATIGGRLTYSGRAIDVRGRTGLVGATIRQVVRTGEADLPLNAFFSLESATHNDFVLDRESSITESRVLLD